jgi:Right handed beta helix region
MLRIAILCIPLAIVTPATAATFHVPAQYPTIQAGMNAAAAGDTVLVSPGVYTDCDGGPCLPSAVQMKEGVLLLSEGGADVTTIRGDNPAGARLVVDARGLGPLGGEIRGFRITASVPGSEGLSSSLSISFIARDCTFEDLHGGMGDGVNLAGTYSVEVLNCVFRQCGAESDGPALFILNVDADVEDCLFEDCVGGGLFMGGHDTQIGTVRNCTFRNNTAASAVSVDAFQSATVEGCRFEGNDPSPNTVGGLQGNAPAGGTLSVRNCVFFGNTSPSVGGAATLAGFGILRFTGNTVVENSGSYFDGSALSLSGTVTFRKNIVASTSGLSAVKFSSSSIVTSSCNVFWNNAGGDFVNYTPDSTDMFADPRFCDEELGDLRLRPDSPCLPENSNGCDLIGAIGEACGPTSVQPMPSSSWGRLKNGFRLPRR